MVKEAISTFVEHEVVIVVKEGLAIFPLILRIGIVSRTAVSKKC
ncbi:predicted protein [Sclerotinia sclerotiorum 1980 UF-70]|uniref:Uncharacterized protein n=1 Tax=Sclerotinia sclerotiorum (strain ATCC 18683 / 1980 / Ss-1) TaxID=665079 RepID=A7E7T0_SCLS1|nr:predicted protein [Sclerotinia sclerotiorum 1980 UF-70]EDN96432.1 predicted protein [Sclerotinia sclerotiorum 1980 UF-70]